VSAAVLMPPITEMIVPNVNDMPAPPRHSIWQRALVFSRSPGFVDWGDPELVLVADFDQKRLIARIERAPVMPSFALARRVGF
jgi:hypothetical protein